MHYAHKQYTKNRKHIQRGNTFVLIPKRNGSKHVEAYAFITIWLKFYSSSNLLVNSKTEF